MAKVTAAMSRNVEGGVIGEDKEESEMKQVWRPGVGSTITVLLVLLLLTGCPKRPEIAETAPKAIGPQGAIAMPASPPSPPTVSAVPPTVSGPEEKSPTEVAVQPQGAEVAPEGKVQEAEVSPTQEAQIAPEAGAAPKARPSEAEVSPAPGASSPPAGEASTGGVSPAAPAEPVAPLPVPALPSPPPAAVPVAEAPKVAELTVKDIYFDFDQAAIRDDSRKTLTDNIQWFKANPAAKVAIEGHCDERGSSEYNLALGERRARVTRDFLVAAGIEGNRISTISFGKERPFVLGHDESAWKWNRRAHFVLSTK